MTDIDALTALRYRKVVERLAAATSDGAVPALMLRYREIIRRHGWAVTGVAEDGRCDTPGCTNHAGGGRHEPMLYTVGLTAMGRPELLVRRLVAARAATLLNAVARQSVEGRVALVAGLTYQAAGLTVAAVRLPARDVNDLCKVARHLYGRHRVRVLELHPADGGEWPT